ncbi:diacylglycerol kinase family protein [Anthocerotibacter panamensis]|uniref:diacylglycerol kinase family protein n=1 Tax=Anthocerotibacter panamensis TaxID=2857077 RepID=UPI001C404E92|nr:diacylglycerol kinase family protein [Anthocerotibacter panamensis]
MTAREDVQPVAKRRSWRVAENLSSSFSYAWAGVVYCATTQRNFRIHLAVGVLAVSLGIYEGISPLEFAVIGLTIALVLTFELLNTALEAVVDLTVGERYHELAKVAKDSAAGAVLIAAIGALFVAGWILVPPLMFRVVHL